MTATVTLTMNPSIDLASETDALALDGRKTRCSRPKRYPGGGGINVARGIHALGGSVLAIYPGNAPGHRSGSGPSGTLLQRLLDEIGLEHRPVAVAGAVRQNLSLAERDGGRHLHLVFPGPELTRDEWQACADAVLAVEPVPGHVVLSGSLPPGVPSAFYADLAMRCAGRGSRVIVDTSGPALEAVLAAGVFLVKPNRREFERLYGLPTDALEPCIEKMDELVARGAVQALVVTVGADGALLVSAEHRVHVRPPSIDGESPVGAGDSLVAALVQRLADGGDLQESLRDGVAAAAAAVSTGGAELYRREDLQALRDAVRVEPLPERATR